MGRHSLQVGDVTDNPLIEHVQSAGAEVLATQSWFRVRQNSITAVAQGILQVLNLILLGAGVISMPWTIAIAAGLVIAETVVHASTLTPVTEGNIHTLTNALKRE